MVKGSRTPGCVRGWAAYSNPGLGFSHLQDELLTVPTFHKQMEGSREESVL